MFLRSAGGCYTIEVAMLAVALAAGVAMVVAGVKPISANIPPGDLCDARGGGMGQCDEFCFDYSPFCIPEYWVIPDPIPCPETEWGPC